MFRDEVIDSVVESALPLHRRVMRFTESRLPGTFRVIIGAQSELPGTLGAATYLLSNTTLDSHHHSPSKSNSSFKDYRLRYAVPWRKTRMLV